MLKLGITGGIGSGKSIVSNYLETLGVSVIDTDKISKELTSSDGDAIEQIKMSFGLDSINKDGSLNRLWMRNRIFLSYTERLKLEAILHPLIIERATIRAKNSLGPYIVFVVPLLVESKMWIEKVDRICIVDCEINDQISRVRERDNISIDFIKIIIDAQISRDIRLSYADDIIYNGREITRDELYKQVLVKHENWCLLSKRFE
ncbi:dephospho-CoA kinase [Candidatus Kinetoplastibacterium desouzaii TCC079E]|uniref:Dephospho-CoA kinase n=1 Tax=Candidatus Kinetoplastidibacterium desouzai TCC079E TaxID=1208919 RepID=M1M2V5_9PROT|nr:dephospho-CoA kinase [Candidatus Kinetoplastibacterium desouzaii]AGF46625.1 dephospho-CoA kinase [Candidatus Kinetoplastibacterium desouzaii TCC079E]